jgi:hypothetical protein
VVPVRVNIAYCAVALVVWLATIGAAGTITLTESWEGAYTLLGSSGTGDPPLFADAVGSPPTPIDGFQTLQLTHNSATGTPTAYVAWVVGLQDGDTVTSSIWRYDSTPGTTPSCRLGAHWNDDPASIDTYSGAAGWNPDAGSGEGWDEVTWEWLTGDGHTGLVIEVRLYSNPGDVVWVDELTVSAPDHSWIWLPQPPAAADPTSWSTIKALYAAAPRPSAARLEGRR